MNVMSPNYQEQLTRRGYIVIPKFLSRIQATDYLDDAKTIEMSFYNKRPERGAWPCVNIKNVLKFSSGFDSLVTHKGLTRIFSSLTGGRYKIMNVGLFIRKKTDRLMDANFLHLDAGLDFQRFRFQNAPLPMQFKAQIFLTDSLIENSGNFCVVPNSPNLEPGALNEKCQIMKDGSPIIDHPLEKQLKLEVGDLVIHNWTCWHRAAPNTSETTRYSISMRITQPFLQSYNKPMPLDVVKRLSSEQKEILGLLDDQLPESVYR